MTISLHSIGVRVLPITQMHKILSSSFYLCVRVCMVVCVYGHLTQKDGYFCKIRRAASLSSYRKMLFNSEILTRLNESNNNSRSSNNRKNRDQNKNRGIDVLSVGLLAYLPNGINRTPWRANKTIKNLWTL